MDVKKIFVSGAGQMGSGITQVAAVAGYEVMMQDVSDAQVKKSREGIVKRLDKLAEKGKISSDDAAAAAARIKTTATLKDIGDADLIIEAATENLELKRELFKQFEEYAKPQAIFASNTSSISITELSSFTKRQEQVVGMHFFNPVPTMKLLEVIRGYSSTEDSVNTALEVGKQMDKVTIVSIDKPGFIVNRMLDPFLNEAVFLVEEGVGTPEDIDKGLKYGCNHPMGPMELIDLIGLDVLLAVMEVLYAEYGDSKYRPAPLLRRMVRAGKLGRKTGEGFYKYD